MRVEEGRGTNEAQLLARLTEACGDDAHTIAVLWTWLSCHMQALGSLEESIGERIRRVDDTPGHERVDDKSMDWLAEDPLPRAAELLQRVARRFTVNEDGQLLGGRAYVETRGIDEEVIVARRNSWLADRAGPDHGPDGPPAAAEDPSLAHIAPRLTVSPRRIDDLELAFEQPSGEGWEAVWQTLAHATSPDGPPLSVHLDPLREHGLSGWRQVEGRPVGTFDARKICDVDERLCVEAARAAVRQAAERTAILVLPELAATPRVEAAIKDELRFQRNAPALTIVGLYHLERSDEGDYSDGVAKRGSLALHVNEAVVLASSGDELWRHRKLTTASDVEGSPPPAEHTRLGTSITVTPTPLGNLTVLICLDAFAEHTASRLAASAAEVLLVPSLSPRVYRHRDALQALVQKLWAVAFVCNRSPHRSDDGTGAWNADENRSFWAIQRKPPSVPDPWREGPHPSFVFRLEREDAA